jgi:hypothetical protein
MTKEVHKKEVAKKDKVWLYIQESKMESVVLH